MNTSVSNRRLRRTQPSRTDSPPPELNDGEPKTSSQGWIRIFVSPNLILLQTRSLYSGVRPRSIFRSLAMLYAAFCVLTFRPLDALNSLAWSKSSPALARAFPGLYKSPLGVLPATLLFSKLAPRLGNLAPNAIQVVLNNPSLDPRPNITCCVWIPDTYSNALDRWTGLTGCASSVLMTTPHEAGSQPHRQLAKSLRRILNKRPRPQTRIILISTHPLLPNTNTYINLARVFANTPWTLLAPPLERPVLPARDFSDTIFKVELGTRILDSSTLFDSKEGLFPDTLLVPLVSPIWCPEQNFAASKGTIPGEEWSACIHKFLTPSNRGED